MGALVSTTSKTEERDTQPSKGVWHRWMWVRWKAGSVVSTHVAERNTTPSEKERGGPARRGTEEVAEKARKDRGGGLWLSANKKAYIPFLSGKKENFKKEKPVCLPLYIDYSSV